MNETVNQRTLMLAASSLQDRADRLRDVAQMTQTLVDKFTRHNGESEPRSDKKEAPKDLIGLFEKSDEEMGEHLREIISNLEKVISWID